MSTLLSGVLRKVCVLTQLLGVGSFDALSHSLSCGPFSIFLVVNVICICTTVDPLQSTGQERGDTRHSPFHGLREVISDPAQLILRSSVGEGQA